MSDWTTITTYPEMNEAIKSYLEGIECFECQYALKRIDELEKEVELLKTKF